ncbi:hypothetical protein [Cryptosporangium arvum]|nr:hypothetical protein [Cryptosporangium arvum]
MGALVGAERADPGAPPAGPVDTVRPGAASLRVEPPEIELPGVELPGVELPRVEEPGAGLPDGEPPAVKPSGAEPPDAEPAGAEPLNAGPLNAGPLNAEPLDAEPLDAEPLDAEPLDAEPLDAELAEVDAPRPVASSDESGAKARARGLVGTPPSGAVIESRRDEPDRFGRSNPAADESPSALDAGLLGAGPLREDLGSDGCAGRGICGEDKNASDRIGSNVVGAAAGIAAEDGARSPDRGAGTTTRASSTPGASFALRASAVPCATSASRAMSAPCAPSAW